MPLPAVGQPGFPDRRKIPPRSQGGKEPPQLPVQNRHGPVRVSVQAIRPEGVCKFPGRLAKPVIPIRFGGLQEVGFARLIRQLAEGSDDDSAAGAIGCQRPANLSAGSLVRDQQEMENISQWRAPASNS